MASQLNTTASIKPDWFGLGTNECFGKTCSFGEFCSKDPLYRTCRLCSDIIAWCDVNRTRLASKYPSCFHICAERDIAELEARLNETKEALQSPHDEVPAWPTLDPLHISLIAVCGTLFLLLLIVSLFWLTRGRAPQILQKMTHCFPGQKDHHHTTLKIQESAGLLSPDIERNENHQPSQTLRDNHHHHHHDQRQHNTTPPTLTHTLMDRPEEDPEDVLPAGGESPEPSAPVQYDTMSMGNPASSTSSCSREDGLGQASTPQHSSRPQTGSGTPASGLMTTQDDLGHASTPADFSWLQAGSGIPALGVSSTQSEEGRLQDHSRLQTGGGIPASGVTSTQSDGKKLGDHSRLQAGSGIPASGVTSTQSEGRRLGENSRLQTGSGIPASGPTSVQPEGMNPDDERSGLYTGVGTTSLGYSSVQPESASPAEVVVWERGSGYAVYPVKVKEGVEDCPKMALGRNTFNTDVLDSLM